MNSLSGPLELFNATNVSYEYTYVYQYCYGRFMQPGQGFRARTLHQLTASHMTIKRRVFVAIMEGKLELGWTGTGSACIKRLRSWMARVFYQHEVYLQIPEIWNDPTSCKRDTKSTSHPGMKLAPQCEFSHVNTPYKPISLISKSLFL